MRKASFGTAIGVILIAAVVAFVTTSTIAPHGTSTSSGGAAPSTYDRVMETKVIKAGWFAEPPFTMYDANTGKRSGIAPDIAAKVEEEYGVKIEWETISNFALMGEDLALGKYDVIFASLFNMPRGGRVESTDPFVFLPTYGYVRRDETRYTRLSDIVAAGTRIAGQEGAAVTDVARKRFPTAEFHIIPSADLADMLLAVSSNKADVAFMIPSFYAEFNAANPGKIKPISDESMQTFSVAFGVKPGEEAFKAMLNGTLHRLIVSGELAAIFTKYDPQHTLLQPIVPMGR